MAFVGELARGLSKFAVATLSVFMLTACDADGGGEFGASKSNPTTLAPTPTEPPTSAQPEDPLGDIVLGDKDAPAEIVLYLSYTCSYCADFHLRTLPHLRPRIEEHGEVRFIVREIVENDFDLMATRLARCGDAEGFHRRVEAILTGRSTWLSDDRREALRHLEEIGERTGLSREQFGECQSDPLLGSALERKSAHLKKRDNLRALPTFFINRVKHSGSISLEALLQKINENNPWRDVR